MRKNRRIQALAALFIGSGLAAPAQSTGPSDNYINRFAVGIPSPGGERYYFLVSSMQGLEPVFQAIQGHLSGPGSKGTLTLTEPFPAGPDDWEAWAADPVPKEVKIYFLSEDTTQLPAPPTYYTASLADLEGSANPNPNPLQGIIRLKHCVPTHWGGGVAQGSLTAAFVSNAQPYNFSEILVLCWDGLDTSAFPASLLGGGPSPR